MSRTSAGRDNNRALWPARYMDDSRLEKRARDSKTLGVFESTQQIQLLLTARALLGKVVGRRPLNDAASASAAPRGAIRTATES